MKRIFLTLPVLLALSSCQREPVDPRNPEAGANSLSIQTSIGDFTTTRSSLVGNSFAERDTIGIALYNTQTEEPYADERYARAYVFTDQRWESPSSFILNEQKGTAYAYYPYSEGVDIDRIPVSLNQTDYLWGVSAQSNLSADRSDGTRTASITMDHLLTRVLVKLYKSSYPQAVVSDIRVRSKAKEILAPDATGVTFSARTGKIAGISRVADAQIVFTDRNADTFEPVTLTEEIPVSPTASAVLLPTAAFESGELEIVVTVNGKEFAVPVPKPSSVEYGDASNGWNQRFSYTYTLAFTGSALAISGVSMIPWVFLPHQDIEVGTDNPYKYSDDKKFCWYKKQEVIRVLQIEDTQVRFAMYSNQEIATSAITAVYPAAAAVNSVQVVKSDMGSNDYVSGERTLGRWRYEVNIALNPNQYTSIERRDSIRVCHNGAPFARIPLLQRKPENERLGFLPGLTLPSGMTLNAEKAEITITPYAQSNLLSIPLASKLTWNDSRTWSTPIALVDETGPDFRSFKVTVAANATLNIRTVPNVSGHDIVQYVVIRFDGGEESVMTKKLKIVHQTIPQRDYDAFEAMCVEMGGQTWMQFNTTGTVTGDYQRARQLYALPGGITVNNIRANFAAYGRFADTYNQAPACPVGFKVPTLQQFCNAFGIANISSLGVITGVASAPVTTPGGMKVSYSRFSSSGKGQALLTIEKNNKTFYLTNGRFAASPARLYFEFWHSGSLITGTAKTNNYNWARRCIKDPSYKGITN